MVEESKRKKAPHDLPRLIQEVLAQLGYDLDSDTVAEHVRRLDIGLPVEDEFSVVCAWLGKCQLLHKLDQQQVPVTSKQRFQVPDLLAKFSTQTNKSPVLIEVKSKKGNVLSFKPDYLERLKRYADLVSMPLLIAWKFHNFWLLFEARHMKKFNKNFNITFETAMKENLIGELAGDIAYKIGEGAGLHFWLDQQGLLSVEKEKNKQTELDTIEFENVYFTNYEKMQILDLESDIKSLFATWDLVEKIEQINSRTYLHYIAEKEGLQFTHMALVRLLNAENPHEIRPHWRSLLHKEKVISSVTDFSSALNKALDQKIVSYIFNIRPQNIPEFLKDDNSS
ncbi:UNVERIFIED_CONTAM: hypothetical protein KWE07_08590 [Acinetobacter pittii]